jgi:hypothetical protein
MACYGASFTIIYPTGNIHEPPRPVMWLALLFYIPQEPPTCLHSLLRGQVSCYMSHRKQLRSSTACNGASFIIIYPTGNNYESPRSVTGLAFLLQIPQEIPTSPHGLLWGLLYYYISHRKHLRASNANYGALFCIIYPTGNNFELPRHIMGLDVLLYIPQETPTCLDGLLRC